MSSHDISADLDSDSRFAGLLQRDAHPWHAKNRKPEKKQQSRPWYDISYDDMMLYDIFDDE